MLWDIKEDLIVKIKFGSHLYGTNTESSDLDIKCVFLPSARDILLQSVNPRISKKRAKAHGEKNTNKDIDREAYDLLSYLRYLSYGQIKALDMLYAPEFAMIKPPHPLWKEVQDFAPKILTRGENIFVEYCRKQANKYGIKGSRVSASRITLDILEEAEKKYGSRERLQIIEPDLQKMVKENEFLVLNEVSEENGKYASYFEVCGRKIMLSTPIKRARELAERLVNAYAQRALAAERNEGIDWKALSHAVRVAHEALEFFVSKHITFPRPEAKHLLEIKQGKLPYHEVAEEIEQLIFDVESAAKTSVLPKEVDQSLIDDFIENIYHKRVIGNI